MPSRAPVLILNLNKERVVCERGFVAKRALARMRGLLGRSDLPEGEGLLLEPAYAIHTAFMRFPIDVVFLDSHMRVMKVVEALRPWRTAGAHQAFSVLELAAGEAGRRGVSVGDRLDVLEVTEPVLARALNSRIRDVSEPDGAPRVLLVSSDRRFRSLAAALFTHRGWPVAVGQPSDDLRALVAQADPDVALVDASHSLTTAAETAGRLNNGQRAVAVVMVSDGSRPALPDLPVHPKWGSFDSLCQAIEEANRNGHHGNGAGSAYHA